MKEFVSLFIACGSKDRFQFNALEKDMNKENRSSALRRLAVVGLMGAALATTACTVVEDAIIRAELDDTKWRAVNIDGFPVPAGVDVTMNLADDGSVSGSAGCNNYSVSDVRTSSGLKFLRIATTRRLCPEPQMTTENAFVEALEGVNNFRHNREGQLILFGPDVMLLFDPVG